MFDIVPPAFIFIIGGLLIPLFKGRLQAVYMLLLPVLGFINLVTMPMGNSSVVSFLDFQVTFCRVDKLSLLFGYIYHLISLITVIYILHVKRNVEYVAGFVYAGAALGAIFAGDLFTFFCFWEMLTVGSVMLIWSRGTAKAQAAGIRYFLVHAVGGLVLLAGIIMRVHDTGSIAFDLIGLDGSAASLCIFLGIGINCAWPMLHSWLVDAYPEATIGGVVFLSAFTTKTAVYALARAFPGTECLIWIGVAMAAFPIFYAVIENDLRKVLAYSLINQVGFMVVGIGIGTELAINGATAHAFNDILFKGLLFMSMGAVMHSTGKINATDLGGLYKYMPWTAAFCIVGAASISAFPLFSGFVSKSMVMEAAAHDQLQMVWLVLLFASAGVFHHAGIKIPFFAFYSHDGGHKDVKEAPLNMLIAMGIAAAFCIGIGVFPKYLYALLPYDVPYEPYTISHIMSQTQLLFFSALAFTLLLLAGIYPAEIRAVNVDSDWIYRKGARLFYKASASVFNGLNAAGDRVFISGIAGSVCEFAKQGPTHLLWLMLSPYWLMQPVEQRDVIKDRLYNEMHTGTVAIGFTALAIGFYAVLLFLR